MSPLSITSRTLAAALGGYVLASLSAMALAVTLPMARDQAVIIGIMVALLLCSGAAIWAFSARSAWRAWAGILAPGVLLGGLYLWGLPA